MHQRQSIAGLPSVSFYPYLLILLNQEIFLSLGKKKTTLLVSYMHLFANQKNPVAVNSISMPLHSKDSAFHFNSVQNGLSPLVALLLG